MLESEWREEAGDTGRLKSLHLTNSKWPVPFRKQNIVFPIQQSD